jgi:hypothetical protein
VRCTLTWKKRAGANKPSVPPVIRLSLAMNTLQNGGKRLRKKIRIRLSPTKVMPTDQVFRPSSRSAIGPENDQQMNAMSYERMPMEKISVLESRAMV